MHRSLTIMRALFVIPGRQLDGGARALMEGAVALAARDSTSVVATVAGGDVERVAHHFSIETVEITARQGTAGRARVLRSIMATHFVDIVFIATESDLFGAAVAARLSGRSVVVRRVGAGETLERHWRSRMAQRLASTGYIVSSAPPATPQDEGATVVHGSLGVRLPDAPADVGRDSDNPRLTCISGQGDAERRALGDVLRAFAMLRERFPRLRMAVLGERSAPADSDVRLHAAALRVSDHVDWLTDPLQRQAALGQSTVGCVAAEGDAAVYGCLDLMAHGVPLVARRTALAQRYVAHGIHGVLMPTLDPARAASELAVMLASPSRREAMGVASRARVARDFSDRTAALCFEQIARRMSGKAV
jgi:hypothetical protein